MKYATNVVDDVHSIGKKNVITIFKENYFIYLIRGTPLMMDEWMDFYCFFGVYSFSLYGKELLYFIFQDFSKILNSPKQQREHFIYIQILYKTLPQTNLYS